MEAKEDILQEALLAAYCYRHQIAEKDAYKYLLLRYLFLHLRKGRIDSLKQRERTVCLGTFLLDELQCVRGTQQEIYLDEEPIAGKPSYGSPLGNILDDLAFQSELLDGKFAFTVEEEIKTLMAEGRKRNLRYADTVISKEKLQTELLSLLREAYHCPQPLRETAVLKRDETLKTTEDLLNDKVSRFQNQPQTTIKVAEKELEEFLFHHLELVEKGLQPLQRQVRLPEGRIDILARDKMGTDVLLELKVSLDTDIVWQRAYYEKEWTKRHCQPRIILIMPSLEDHLKQALQKMGNTEVLLFQPVVLRDELVDVRFTKRIGIKE